MPQWADSTVPHTVEFFLVNKLFSFSSSYVGGPLIGKIFGFNSNLQMSPVLSYSNDEQGPPRIFREREAREGGEKGRQVHANQAKVSWKRGWSKLGRNSLSHPVPAPDPCSPPFSQFLPHSLPGLHYTLIVKIHLFSPSPLLDLLCTEPECHQPIVKVYRFDILHPSLALSPW